MISISVLSVLLLGCALAWAFVFGQKETFQRWWYTAGDKSFLKNSNLDVGWVLLFLVGNFVLLAIVLSSTIFTAAANQPNVVTNPVDPTTIKSGAVETGAVETGAAQTGAAGPSRLGQDFAWDQLTYHWIQVFGIVGLIGAAAVVYRTPINQWGLGFVSSRKFAETLRMGLLGAVLLIPMVLLLHAILTLFFPYQHQTLNRLMLARTEGQWWVIGMIYLQTALVVPICEEFIFRVIGQGFFEQAMKHAANATRLAIGPLSPTIARRLNLETLAESANRSPPKSPPDRSLRSPRFWAPIVFASLLFSLAHFGQGAAPISLYFFAMGLGFLYKTTGNVGLCILIHMLLNSLSLTHLLFASE